MTEVTREPPAELAAQYEQIAARAAAAGQPLQPVPALELTTRSTDAARRGPHGADRPWRVRLNAGLLEMPPAERAWPIAHELSHVLHRQAGPRRANRGVVVLTGGIAVCSVAAVLAAAHSALFGDGTRAGPLLAAALVGALAQWLVFLGLVRGEETTADITAAAVFGEVLTAAGVARLRRQEGRLARYVPTLLRTHAHPEARRQAGTDAVKHRDRSI